MRKFPDTKIFLASAYSMKSTFRTVETLKPHFLLETFLNLKKNTLVTQTFIDWFFTADEILLDSGAFTYMQNPSKKIDIDQYILDYTNFINKYDIKHFFEMDIDKLVGYEEVKKYRKRIETLTNKQVIPVWHITRGAAEFMKMIDEYKYVAIGGIASKELTPKNYDLMFDLCDKAHYNGNIIHGLGFLQTKYLNNNICRFDTVDGTAWQGHIHQKSFTYDDINKKIIGKEDHSHWRSICVQNYEAWTKFSYNYYGSKEEL